MTAHSVPMPGPDDFPVFAMSALVHELARAYLNSDARTVAALDQQISSFAYTGPSPTTDQAHHDDPSMGGYLAVNSAELMMQEWRARESDTTSLPEALASARSLAARYGPPALRKPLRDTFDHVLAGQVELFAVRHPGLPDHGGAHLFAAVTAAYILLMNPVLHNHARLVLEERVRVNHTMSRGMPGTEAVGFVPEPEAAALLTELLPWTADMTGDAHETTKRDLHALIQLYLLDHPVPTDQQRAELTTLIGDRIHELAAAVARPARRPAAVPTGLTREQQVARRRAERARRRRKRPTH